MDPASVKLKSGSTVRYRPASVARNPVSSGPLPRYVPRNQVFYLTPGTEMVPAGNPGEPPLDIFCLCFNVAKPVCGADGNSYENVCQAKQ